VYIQIESDSEDKVFLGILELCENNYQEESIFGPKNSGVHNVGKDETRFGYEANEV
jgi:hypothetical protein